MQVTASQWWWNVRYKNDDPSQVFDAPNEIHIPVGRPVRVELSSTDVIHSFWIPQLAGKMDVIPGQTNVTWLQADKPGVYRGQCGEYCGAQHAHMAHVRGRGRAARTTRPGRSGSAPRPAPATQAALLRGQQTFVNNCGACHAVRGTGAGGHPRPGPHPPEEPADDRRRPAAQHARQPVGVDRQRAGAQARHAHADDGVVGLRPERRRRLPRYLELAMAAVLSGNDALRVPVIARPADDTSIAPRLDRIWETRKGLLGALSSVDHKTIGKRYLVTAFVFLLIGGLEAAAHAGAAGAPEPDACSRRNSTTSCSRCTA